MKCLDSTMGSTNKQSQYTNKGINQYNALAIHFFSSLLFSHAHFTRYRFMKPFFSFVFTMSNKASKVTTNDAMPSRT